MILISLIITPIKFLWIPFERIHKSIFVNVWCDCVSIINDCLCRYQMSLRDQPENVLNAIKYIFGLIAQLQIVIIHIHLQTRTSHVNIRKCIYIQPKVDFSWNVWSKTTENMNVSIYLLKKTCIISKNLIVTYKIFEKCNYIQWKFIIICINLQEKLLKLSLDVKFIREYLTLHDQFN